MENQKEESDYYPPFNPEAARWFWIAQKIEHWMLEHRRNDFHIRYPESKDKQKIKLINKLNNEKD